MREDTNPLCVQNPAHLDFDFLETNLVQISCGGFLIASPATRKHSPLLKELELKSNNLTKLEPGKTMGFYQGQTGSIASARVTYQNIRSKNDLPKHTQQE